MTSASGYHSDVDVTLTWAAIADQWSRREDETMRELLLALAGDEVASEGAAAAIATLHDEEASIDGSSAIENAIATLMRIDAPIGAAMAYLQALMMWERSDELRQISAIAGALRRLNVAQGSSGEHLVRATAGLTKALQHQLLVENAVFCSCPVALEEHATLVLDGIAGATAELALADQEGGTHHVALRDLLVRDVSTLQTYYQCIGKVATAAGMWIDDRSTSGEILASTIAALKVGEHQLSPDVFESELRSHRLTLEAMASHLDGGELWLDRGRVVYLYPFGLPSEPPEQLVHDIYDGTRRPDSLCGAAPIWVDRALIAGSWQQDRLLGVRNELVTIALEPLELRATSGDIIADIRPEIRLSSAGNHLLRVELDVSDLSMHELDQHVRRIGEEMGHEQLRFRSDADMTFRWTMLCDFARDVMEDLERHLSATARQPPVPELPGIDVLTGAHVVVSARRLTVHYPTGDEHLCDVGELPEHLGASILLRPAREQPSSLESWVRRRGMATRNLLAVDGDDDELIVRSPGLTLVYLPGAADWQIDIRDEMAEFTASLSGLMHSWSLHLGTHAPAAEEDLAAVEATGDAGLVRARMQLLARDFSRVQMMLTQLRSANVCRQAGDRELLEKLRHAANADELERALHEAVAVLTAQQARLTEEAERIQLDHEHEAAAIVRAGELRRERMQQVLELGVTALALNTVFGLMNDAFDVSGAFVPLTELGIIVLAAIALVLGFTRDTTTEK